MLREYKGMKEEIKNPKYAVEYTVNLWKTYANSGNILYQLPEKYC